MVNPDFPSADQESKPLRVVLIGTSLEEESDNVVSTGLAVARAAGAKVHLLHAAPVEPRVDFALGFGPELYEQTAWREEKLARQVERLSIQETEIAGMAVRVGAPHRVLTQAAQSEGADLVVVSATRVGPLAADLLGSTADRVLRKAILPVLVVRGELPVPPRRVTAPVDLSPLSAEALRSGLRLLSRLAGNQEIAVRVVHALSILDVLAGHPRGLQEISFEQEQQRYAEELRRFVERNRVDGPFRLETAILPGEAHHEIVHDLHQNPADLVLLGPHGRGGFDRLVLGSVAASVARKAPCSVLMLPPAAARELETAAG